MDNMESYPDVFEETPVDFRRYLTVLWKKRLFIAVPALLALGAALFVASRIEPMYEASTTIILKKKASFSRPLQSLLIEDGIRERLNLVKNHILSTGFLMKVIATEWNTSLDSEEETSAQGEKSQAKNLDLLVDYFRKIVSVEIPFGGRRGSSPNVFRIVVSRDAPEKAARMANTIAHLFIAENRDTQLRQMKTASAFTLEQLALYKKKLEESEEQFRKYQEEAASAPETGGTWTERLIRINASMMDAKVDLQQETDKWDTLKRKAQSPEERAALRTELPHDPELSLLRDALSKRESELTDLLIGKTWRDPVVLSTNEKIYQITQTIHTRIDRLISQSYPRFSSEFRRTFSEIKLLEIKIALIEERKKKLQAALDELKRRHTKDAEYALTLQRLGKAVENNRKIYDAFLEQSMAVQVSEALEMAKLGSEFEILEPARKPLYPKKSGKVKIVLLGSFFGSALGLGLVLLIEALDRSFKTIDEVESSLGLPVLGTIPLLRTSSAKRKGRLGIELGSIVLFVFLCEIAMAFKIFIFSD